MIICQILVVLSHMDMMLCIQGSRDTIAGVDRDSYAFNPGTWKADIGKQPWVQGLSWLGTIFYATLNCKGRTYLKHNKQNKLNTNKANYGVGCPLLWAYYNQWYTFVDLFLA